MHQKQRDKYLTRPNSKGPYDHTVQEMLDTAKRVYLTQKLLGNVNSNGCVRFVLDGRLHNLENIKQFAHGLIRTSINEFQLIALHWKGYLPRINKAMARRMLLSYQRFQIARVKLNRFRQRPPSPDYHRIIQNQALREIENRLYPLSFEQYTAFANHVYEKRGSPKYYKKNIDGVRFGNPHTFRERDSGNYRIERYVGVQTCRDEKTGHLSVKMGIVNEKRQKPYADTYRP